MFNVTTPTLTLPVTDRRDHLLGPRSAPVILCEYGDFECPVCGQAYGVLKEFLQAAGDRARLAYRHFPLTQIHPHSQRTAEAAEAAGAQGRFLGDARPALRKPGCAGRL